MDLVGACRVFVEVAEHGSFTLGAAAARVPQSVASRRVAALEEHLGQSLFDRSARRAVLTAFGRDMLPSAKRLVHLAEALEYHAEEAKLRPLSIAMPETCSIRQLARLDAAARDAGLVLDVRRADPVERAELVRSLQVRVALVAVAARDAEWVVPLGLASAGADDRETVRLETFRPSRGEQHTLRRIWIQPEDDVPHVRDPLQHAGHRAALLPAQITVAKSLIAAAGETIRSDDELLCSARQARDLGLTWRPLSGVSIARGYDVSALTGDDAARVGDVLGERIGRALGVPAVPAVAGPSRDGNGQARSEP